MKIPMKNLLALIPREEDRARMRELSRRYRTARADGVLDDVLLEIEKHWRAVRRPMPTREEIREMLDDER
jgi:hypothetical protein